MAKANRRNKRPRRQHQSAFNPEIKFDRRRDMKRYDKVRKAEMENAIKERQMASLNEHQVNMEKLAIQKSKHTKVAGTTFGSAAVLAGGGAGGSYLSTMGKSTSNQGETTDKDKQQSQGNSSSNNNRPKPYSNDSSDNFSEWIN